MSVVLTFFQLQCSFSPTCKRDELLNEANVKDYCSKWAGDQKLFSCLYHPERHKEVVREIRFDERQVLHLMLWPSIFGLLFAFAVFLTYKIYGCRDCKICINRLYRSLVLCENMQQTEWTQ